MSNVQTGQLVRVSTDRFDDEPGDLHRELVGTVVESDLALEGEVAVRFDALGDVYYVQPDDIEPTEVAAFTPGDLVRVVSSIDPLVEPGTEGEVLHLEDDRLFLDILMYGEPPVDLNIVLVDDGYVGLRNSELELVTPADERAEQTPLTTFNEGDRVRVLRGDVSELVQDGDEGYVVSKDDDRIGGLARLLTPESASWVTFPGLENPHNGDELVQVFSNDDLLLLDAAPESTEEKDTTASDGTLPGFPVGTQVQILDNSENEVEVGALGKVVSIDDPRLWLHKLMMGIPREDLVIVDLGNDDYQTFEQDRLAVVIDDQVVENNEVPTGTHVILTTDEFPPYMTGDRGVVAGTPTERGSSYYQVTVGDDPWDYLVLADDEFTVAADQPTAEDKALDEVLDEWEQELLAELLDVTPAVEVEETKPLNDYVAFEVEDESWGEDVEIRILNVHDTYVHLEVVSGDERVAPKLSAATRRALGQALLDTADLGE